MHVQRFLGSAWASVHGPSDPKRLLVSVLEARFAGLALAPGPRALDIGALSAAAADLPFEFAATRAADPLAEHSATAGFASGRDGERQLARRAVHDAVVMARTIGNPLVVLDVGVVPMVGEIAAEDLGDPQVRWTKEAVDALQARRKVGRNATVDRVCRELFDRIRDYPDIQFCLTQSRSLRGVLDVAAMRDICEDLASKKLGYWHDAAICARRQQVLAEPAGEWLEVFGNRCRGMSLGDASPDGLYLPPGAGGVDYGMLGTYVPNSGAPLPVVLELDVSVPASELPGMRSCLDKFGL